MLMSMAEIYRKSSDSRTTAKNSGEDATATDGKCIVVFGAVGHGNVVHALKVKCFLFGREGLFDRSPAPRRGGDVYPPTTYGPCIRMSLTTSCPSVICRAWSSLASTAFVTRNTGVGMWDKAWTFMIVGHVTSVSSVGRNASGITPW